MATITGANIYIDGIKRNSSPISLTGTYNISQWKQPGDSFDVQASYVYDDGSESPLSTLQTHKLLVPTYTSDADAATYLDTIGVPTTDVPYLIVGMEVLTGEQVRYAWNKFVSDTKAAGAYQKAVLLYPEIGGTIDTNKVNAISPANTAHYLQYEGNWKHDAICSYNLDDNSPAKVGVTYMSLGLNSANLTIGGYVINVGSYEGNGGNTTMFLFGNSESTYQRTLAAFEKDNFYGGLNTAQLSVNHNRNDSKVNFLITANGDGNANFYINKTNIKTEPVVAGDLPDGQDPYIRLHGLNGIANRSSFQLATMYLIGQGMTLAEINAWTDAVEELMVNLKRTSAAVVPESVFVPAQVSSLYGIYWPVVYKSSDWPEFTTTKPYFTIWSTDHDETDYEGGIWWGEMDDPSFNGFVEKGLIISGLQAEGPYLNRIPTSVSGLASDEIFLYYHGINAVGDVYPQRSRLITTSGGAEPHLSTWNTQADPFPLVGTEDHAGYGRVFTRDDGTYVANRLTQSFSHPDGPAAAIDESTDGLSFTRLQTWDQTVGMPIGYVFKYNNICPFKRNGVWYGFIAVRKDGVANTERIAVATLDNNFLPTGIVEYITSIVDARTLTAYTEGNIGYVHFKGGSNQDRLQDTYQIKYDLTRLD